MKADERNMADSQAVVYRGISLSLSLCPDRRFSFSSVVSEQAVWLVVRLGYFRVGGRGGIEQLFQVKTEILLCCRKSE